ncbi:MAG: reverse transcriptase domain-containing protein [Thiotrichales bacterium]
MSDLLEQAMSPETLNAAWRRLKSEHTPWSPTVRREELQKDLFRHMLVAREEVLSGSYKPLPLRQFSMRKADGRQRVISAFYLKDKLVQRALLLVLEPGAEAIFHADSYAYRPARSIHQALDKTRERVRVGMDWLVDADIRSFFDSIPHKNLIKRLRPFVADKPAMVLIERWLKTGAHQSSLLSSSRGISQGAILSPLFCNLYLHGFDSALAKANIRFVRYADDFLLFASKRQDAMKAMAFSEKLLHKMGLELHPEKTRVVRSGPEVSFLGAKLPGPNR